MQVGGETNESSSRSICRLCLGFVIPALSQSSTGKIHGRVLDPAAMAKTSGNVALSVDGGYNSRYTFPVNENGDYAGEGIEPGTYSVIYRAAESVSEKYVDQIKNVKIVAGEDTLQNIDMSRKEYIDSMSPSSGSNWMSSRRRTLAQCCRLRLPRA